MGGIVQAVGDGAVQRKVARQAYEYERGLQDGTYRKVGLNIHAGTEEPEVDLHEYSFESADQQLSALKKLRAERSDADVKTTLTALEQAAGTRKTSCPPWSSAARLLHRGRNGRIFARSTVNSTSPGLF